MRCTIQRNRSRKFSFPDRKSFRKSTNYTGLPEKICECFSMYLKAEPMICFLYRIYVNLTSRGCASMRRYELLDHTADIGIVAFGRDLPEAFAAAAYAMFDILTDIDNIQEAGSFELQISAINVEELLLAWLDELLYDFYTKGIIFCDFDIVDIADTRIKAHAHGRHIADNRNRLKTEIKAATYHDLKIEEDNNMYSVEIVFDV